MALLPFGLGRVETDEGDGDLKKKLSSIAVVTQINRFRHTLRGWGRRSEA